jgi:hypothetical protein
LPDCNETAEKDFKLSCSCGGPAIRSTIFNLLSEFIATFSSGEAVAVGGLEWARDFGLRLTDAILLIAGKGGLDQRYAPKSVRGK